MNTTAIRGSKNRTGIQVISRAAHILRSLEDEPNGLSLAEIASRVALPRSTVQRIVDALADENFVIAATPRARVMLGPALARLAHSVRLNIADFTMPYLHQMSEELGETVDLSVLRGDRAVFLAQLPGRHRLRTVSAAGESFTLHDTACGKVLLALSDLTEREELISRAITEEALETGQIRSLRTDVAAYEKGSLCFDLDEHTDGISAVATGFLDPSNRPVAISVPVPTSRFPRVQKTVEQALLTVHSQIVGNTKG